MGSSPAEVPMDPPTLAAAHPPMRWLGKVHRLLVAPDARFIAGAGEANRGLEMRIHKILYDVLFMWYTSFLRVFLGRISGVVVVAVCVGGMSLIKFLVFILKIGVFRNEKCI